MAYNTINETSAHVLNWLPVERTHVKSLVKSIVSKDDAICAALTNIKLNTPGMQGGFEKANLYLSLTCPVANKQSNKKNVLFDAGIDGTTDQKPVTGSMGVEHCYYKTHEFKKLLPHQ